MQNLSIFLVVFGFFLIAEGSLTNEQKANILSYKNDCTASSSINSDLLKKAHSGEFSDSAPVKAYFLCMAKRMGFLNDNGVFQKNVMKEKIGSALDDPALAGKITEECAVAKASPQETAFEAVKCFYKNTPLISAMF